MKLSGSSVRKTISLCMTSKPMSLQLFASTYPFHPFTNHFPPLHPITVSHQSLKVLSLSACRSAATRLHQDVVDYPQPFIPFRNSKSKEASQLNASFPKPPSASDFLLGEMPPSCRCLPNLCTSFRVQSAKDFFVHNKTLFQFKYLSPFIIIFIYPG